MGGDLVLYGFDFSLDSLGFGFIFSLDSLSLGFIFSLDSRGLGRLHFFLDSLSLCSFVFLLDSESLGLLFSLDSLCLSLCFSLDSLFLGLFLSLGLHFFLDSLSLRCFIFLLDSDNLSSLFLFLGFPCLLSFTFDEESGYFVEIFGLEIDFIFFFTAQEFRMISQLILFRCFLACEALQ